MYDMPLPHPRHTLMGRVYCAWQTEPVWWCLAALLLHVCIQMLDGSRQSAQLMAINASDPEGWAPGHTGSTGACSTGAVSSTPCVLSHLLVEPAYDALSAQLGASLTSASLLAYYTSCRAAGLG